MIYYIWVKNWDVFDVQLGSFDHQILYLTLPPSKRCHQDQMTVTKIQKLPSIFFNITISRMLFDQNTSLLLVFYNNQFRLTLEFNGEMSLIETLYTNYFA